MERSEFHNPYSALQHTAPWLVQQAMLVEVTGESLYGIGAVSKMVGVAQQTLRTWEDRYGQVVPERTPGGQRLYSRDQVDQLRFVVQAMSRGIQPADAHRLLAERSRQPIETQGELDQTFAILIADRDHFSADLCEYFLRTEGYAVRIASDAGSAQHILQHDPPSLAVIDLLISGGMGAQLCLSTRQHLGIPILATSTLESHDDALNAGADAFLGKPIDPLRYVSTVRDLLGTSAYVRRPVWAQ
jgi:DNA-binding transcriptional MerR regulator